LLVWFLVLGASAADAQDRFIDNGDGTVTDTKLDLMWAQEDNKADIYWQEAPSWIKNIFENQIGPRYDNWRLPTLSELKSLYLESPNYNGYRSQCGHYVRMVPEIKISCILVWSSNTALGLPLVFNYYLGAAFTVDLADNKGCRVLPVRKIR
jgi:hypothetical protein